MIIERKNLRKLANFGKKDVSKKILQHGFVIFFSFFESF